MSRIMVIIRLVIMIMMGAIVLINAMISARAQDVESLYSSSTSLSPSSDGFRIPLVLKNPRLYYCTLKCNIECFKQVKQPPVFGSCITLCVSQNCLATLSDTYMCTFTCTTAFLKQLQSYGI